MICHEILEKTDAYLWSKRPSVIPPQIRAVLEEELQHSSNSVGSYAIPPTLSFLAQESNVRQPATLLQRVQLTFDHVVPLPKFYEDSAGHWGVPLDLSASCVRCTHPLSKALEPSGNIVVFPCGHGFHQFCCEEDACITCFRKNFQPLLSRKSK
jgi:hypothetical protein